MMIVVAELRQNNSIDMSKELKTVMANAIVRQTLRLLERQQVFLKLLATSQ
jgi:hypothetical protein